MKNNDKNKFSQLRRRAQTYLATYSNELPTMTPEDVRELVHELVLAFLSARFVGNDPGQERHKRRVGKVRKIEAGKSDQ